MFKKWLPIRVHKVTLFSGFCLLGHLWGPNPLFDIKSGPQRSQSASNDRKLTQKWYQRAPRLRKRAPKDKPVRALRNIVKQKNAMTQHTHIFTIMKNPARRTAQKVTPKDPKRSKHDFKCAFVGDLAWRTARSAFNKFLGQPACSGVNFEIRVLQHKLSNSRTLWEATSPYIWTCAEDQR